MVLSQPVPAQPAPAQPEPLGAQRDWIWRGWRVRYTFKRSATSAPPIL
ncbi:MAG: hypothetical protein HC772_19255, partial [Leptolyngbyaceae cyanobacterium CRU_2_3]|nr:hypothetical protein [Leptolyngbyaceae cyanobacterium CRU_2_3]